MIVVM